jgi:hypothetical protein
VYVVAANRPCPGAWPELALVAVESALKVMTVSAFDVTGVFDVPAGHVLDCRAIVDHDGVRS